MPESGFCQLLMLIGLLTVLYFVGSFLDFCDRLFRPQKCTQRCERFGLYLCWPHGRWRHQLCHSLYSAVGRAAPRDSDRHLKSRVPGKTRLSRPLLGVLDTLAARCFAPPLKGPRAPALTTDPHASSPACNGQSGGSQKPHQEAGEDRHRQGAQNHAEKRFSGGYAGACCLRAVKRSLR
jgi:hypothetical protein